MFGREAERAQVEQLLDRAVDGPVGIALEGAPGIGKTTVWRDAVQSAHRRGYLVLESVPSEPDMGLAFSGLGDLFDQLDQELIACLPDPQRKALAAALFVGDVSEAPADLLALPRAALGLLRRLSVQQPVVLAIDDEQWLDRASARVLAFALTRIREERICLLLARRTDGDGALWPEVSRGFINGVEVVAVPPLDIDATRRLLSEASERKLTPTRVQRVHQMSGGNPLYALAIGRELARSSGNGASGRELPIPRTLTDAISQRLAHLAAEARPALLAVASLAAPTMALLAAAIEPFEPQDLDSALQAGVVTIDGAVVRFTHPLLASVHYTSTPASVRRELHRRLAVVVEDEVESARHLALGTEAYDEQVAVRLERAAEAAARRGAPEVAAELLQDAIRLTPADLVNERSCRTIAAAEQHYVAGSQLQARGLLEELLPAMPGGPTRARALTRLARIRSDDFRVGASLLREALADVGDDHRLRAEIEMELTEGEGMVGHVPEMLEAAERAVQSAERAGDQGLLALALGVLGAAEFFGAQRIRHDLLDRAVELEQFVQEMNTMRMPSSKLGSVLGLSDDFDAARPLVEGALRRATRRGEETDRGYVLVGLVQLELGSGNPGAAERYAAEGAEAARQQANDELDCWVVHADAIVAAARGRLEQARERAGVALELAVKSGNESIGLMYMILIGDLELRSGDPEAAHRRLKPLREAAGGAVFLGSMMLPMWSSDIEALIAIGRFDEAREVLDDLLERVRTCENPHAVAIAHRCEGLLLAAQGDLDRAIERMEAALAEHARRTLPLEYGRTLIEKGAIQRRAKHKSAAKRTLTQAVEILEPLGTAIWLSRARDELGRIGLRRSVASDGLTPAQERVAELVAAGMANREIANTLYMSQRSVEAHLTKIYRELGVRSRAQLAASLATAGTGDRPNHPDG